MPAKSKVTVTFNVDAFRTERVSRFFQDNEQLIGQAIQQAIQRERIVPLPNRGKQSIVMEVLADGRTKNAGNLTTAVTKYFEAIREKSYKLAQDGPTPSRGFMNPLRERALAAITGMEAEIVRLRKAFDEQLADYDMNERELNAWEQTAEAARRVTGQG